MKNLIILMAMALYSSLLAVEIPIINPEFNIKDGKITGWQSSKNNHGTVSSVPVKGSEGFSAVKISSIQANGYFGVYQGNFDLKKFPRPGENEELHITIEYHQKNENVINGGFANVSFYSSKGYIAGRDTPKQSGSFDWKKISTTVKFEKFPPEAKFFTLYLYLGNTTGTVYFAKPKLFVNAVKKIK